MELFSTLSSGLEGGKYIESFKNHENHEVTTLVSSCCMQDTFLRQQKKPPLQMCQMVETFQFRQRSDSADVENKLNKETRFTLFSW